VVDVEIGNLEDGLAAGWSSPAGNVASTVAVLDAALADPADWTWTRPADAGVGTRRLASAEAKLAHIAEASVLPALRRYRDFLAGPVTAAARSGTREGVSALPDGAACYAALVRLHTTLDRSADEFHALGLAEMERNHADFLRLGATTYGTSDLATLFERLRTDPALKFQTSDAVAAEASRTLAAAEAAVPRWFARAPKTPCTVEPMPQWEAPWSTIAYYRPAEPNAADRHGTYVINTYAPETRPRHEAPALSFHEAVPGHHFQVSFSQELGELPAFRRYDGVTAFVEGWALYAEVLADEMGLYRDDVERLGMLSLQAWRIARLVVDTGLHAKGWTREQAIAWMEANTPLAPNNIVNEVDRYVSWPGQALGYKVGQLEILALRREAESALGPAFDVREFHDVVLGAGAVSLPVLRSRVGAWVAAVDKPAGPL
jgi:uncharacterized protein (DUF885 family)